jgi:hypothetical protein
MIARFFSRSKRGKQAQACIAPGDGEAFWLGFLPFVNSHFRRLAAFRALTCEIKTLPVGGSAPDLVVSTKPP